MKEIQVKVIRENKTKYTAEMPALAAKYWEENIATEDFDIEKEHLIVLILNSKLAVKAHNVVTMGLINQTVVHAREVFRPAIAYAGAHILLMHNHPSGDTTPSADDIRTTRDISECGKILGIPLLDHVVVSSDGKRFESLKEKGILN